MKATRVIQAILIGYVSPNGTESEMIVEVTMQDKHINWDGVVMW